MYMMGNDNNPTYSSTHIQEIKVLDSIKKYLRQFSIFFLLLINGLAFFSHILLKVKFYDAYTSDHTKKIYINN